MKVLVSAYACYPPTTESCTDEERKMADGEALLGWNLITQIANYHDVWIITQARNRSGIERFLAGRHKIWPHTVRFYYCDFPGWPEPFWDNQILNHFYYYFWQILALLKAQNLHRLVRFDLSHHVTYANDWMPSFIGAFLPIPFVWGPIGGGHRTPKVLLREYSRTQRWAELFRLAVQWIGRNLLISRRLCQRRAKAILVCNYETKRRIPAFMQSKAFMFPVNSISAEDIGEAPVYSRSGSLFKVLSAGRLRPLKGFGLAIKAFAEFAKKRPNSSLEIIGDGPELAKLKGLARSLGVGDHVFFSPWLPRNEVLRRMKACDVFLFPSFREGGGAVIIEAMANGKPVIGLDTGGPAFHIRPQWGIKIKPESYEHVLCDIVRALEDLSADADLRMRLGHAALRRSKEYYLLEPQGRILKGIYSKVLS